MSNDFVVVTLYLLLVICRYPNGVVIMTRGSAANNPQFYMHGTSYLYHGLQLPLYQIIIFGSALTSKQYGANVFLNLRNLCCETVNDKCQIRFATAIHCHQNKLTIQSGPIDIRMCILKIKVNF